MNYNHVFFTLSYYITFLQADACTYHYIKSKRITWLGDINEFNDYFSD